MGSQEQALRRAWYDWLAPPRGDDSHGWVIGPGIGLGIGREMVPQGGVEDWGQVLLQRQKGDKYPVSQFHFPKVSSPPVLPAFIPFLTPAYTNVDATTQNLYERGGVQGVHLPTVSPECPTQL